MRTARAKATSTKAQLLLAAERLFAIEGLDAVSLRRIAAEAGQRNPCVAQYHFGSREALIEALIERRMTPINARRRALLDAALHEARTARRTPDVVALVTVLVLPLAEQLLDGEQGAYYLRFIGELFARGDAVRSLGEPRPWNEAFFATVAALRDAVPASVRGETLDGRLVLMAGQMAQAMSAHELALRGIEGAERRDAVRVVAEQLIDFLSGALVAEARADVSALLIRD